MYKHFIQALFSEIHAHISYRQSGNCTIQNSGAS